MIAPSFVHELLSRTDIVEVVGRHVALRKAGINHQGLCPFHAEKTPSFTVSASRQTYHCFGCGAHGNAVGFLMEHAGLGFVDAVHELAQQSGLVVPDDDFSPEERQRHADAKRSRATLSDVLGRAAEHYRRGLKATPRAIDYLKGRGLSGEIASRFALGYAADSWRGLASAFPAYDDPLLEASGLVISREAESGDAGDAKRYDRFRDRIMFPIRAVQGEIIGFGGRVLDRGEPKYLNSPETAIFVKGRELYGLFEARTAIRQHGFALVVEGYMDVVALAQAGVPHAVATLGTACSAEHVQKLFRFTESIVFSFDGDAAGRRAAARALEAALPLATDTRTTRFLFLPEGEDPDSYIRANGAAAFERCIADAVPLSRQLVEQAGEGCALDTAEGRARFLAAARPLWSMLPDGALRQQMLQEIARTGGLSNPELATLWQLDKPGTAPAGADRRPLRDAPARSQGGSANAARQPSRRPAPSTPADHALRMLLLNSGWWERLGHDDHALLHELPPPHGGAFAWLERYLSEHGPSPWAVLEQALVADAMAEEIRHRVPAAAFEDKMDFAELRRVIDGIWVEQLSAQTKTLIEAAATDAHALQRWREVELERQARLARMRGPV